MSRAERFPPDDPREWLNRARSKRYPGLDEPVSEQEYTEAVVTAETVVRWAEGRL